MYRIYIGLVWREMGGRYAMPEVTGLYMQAMGSTSPPDIYPIYHALTTISMASLVHLFEAK